MDIESIPPLPDMTFCHNMTGNLAFFDTEGLDYQTELGDNYDIVTILPHTLIAENVFLVVTNRLNPNEIKELIDRLAEAAKKTEGTFAFRNGKLFGNLIIIVNKCQARVEFRAKFEFFFKNLILRKTFQHLMKWHWNLC